MKVDARFGWQKEVNTESEAIRGEFANAVETKIESTTYGSVCAGATDGAWRRGCHSNAKQLGAV